MLLCGVGDWLIGYEPPGGEPLVFGISSTSIIAVPTWFYILSLFFGILSGFGCRYFAPAMIGFLEKNDVFLLPAAASLLPFVAWCFLCDIPVLPPSTRPRNGPRPRGWSRFP